MYILSSEIIKTGLNLKQRTPTGQISKSHIRATQLTLHDKVFQRPYIDLGQFGLLNWSQRHTFLRLSQLPVLDLGPF